MNIPLDATVDQRVACLRESGVWASLSEPGIGAVAAAMQPAAYRAGEFIIRQGEPGRYLHVLTNGATDVRMHAPGGVVITVAELSAGACFGEMSLLSGDLTSADVIARTDCQTLTLDRRAFEALVAAEPQLLREFVRVVSKRLRESNVAMGAAREKEKGLTRFLQDAGTELYGEIVGASPAIRALQKQIDTQAKLDGPVLIEGERGTGKELIARLIHFRSARKDAPLLSTDCAQVVETPWGDKLFGDYRPPPGGTGPPPPVCYLDLAGGGTIVLKDIAALPRPTQDRLATYLEEQAGGSGSDHRRVRVIATSCERLDDPANARNVSPALASVLAAETLAVPPLRQRKRDIAALAAHLAARHAQRLGKAVPALDDEALGKLVTHEYLTANVHELEEVIRRAVILTDGPRIESEAIFLGVPAPASRWAFNLLSLPEPLVRRTLRLFPRAAQGAAALVFAFILYQCWFVPAGPGGNLGTLLVWSVWWPMLVLSFFFAGRAWCAICPMMSAAGATQRLVNLEWHVPAWLRRHDVTIVMAGFLLIVWAEQATQMRHSPRATGALLLAIMVGAVVTAALLPRRSWCRYVCPLGGLAGVSSMTGLLELRPTPDICAAKCRDHACYKGDEHGAGCPMFNHVMFVESNQHCVLCLNCLQLCTDHSPQLNVRLPALDLLPASGDRSHAGRVMVLLAGLLVGLVVLQRWEGQTSGLFAEWLRSHRLATVTAVLGVGAVLPQAGLRVLARRVARRADPAASRRFWQRVTAWVPAVTAGFVAYEFTFIPGFDAVRVTLAVPTLAGGAARELAFGLLGLAQGAALLAGLAVSLVVSWNLRRAAPTGARRPLPRPD